MRCPNETYIPGGKRQKQSLTKASDPYVGKPKGGFKCHVFQSENWCWNQLHKLPGWTFSCSWGQSIKTALWESEREKAHAHTPWNMRGQIMSHARPLKITLRSKTSLGFTHHKCDLKGSPQHKVEYGAYHYCGPGRLVAHSWGRGTSSPKPAWPVSSSQQGNPCTLTPAFLLKPPCSAAEGHEDQEIPMSNVAIYPSMPAPGQSWTILGFTATPVGTASPGHGVCVHLFKVVDMSLAQEVPSFRKPCSKYCPPLQPFQGFWNRCSDYSRSLTCTNRDWSH